MVLRKQSSAYEAHFGWNLSYGDEVFFAHTVDTIRARYTTLYDFPLKGRAYFADDFDIEPKALEKLDAPGARALLRELADRLDRVRSRRA